MELWLGAVNLGFLFFFMAIGCYITYKIYDFADITVDGSFTTGAAVSSVLIINGYNPFTSLLIAFIAGAIAGMATGIIHTKFKINGLLSGILVMTGLYSINLRIMEKSNIPLMNSNTIVSIFDDINPGLNGELWFMICASVLVLLAWMIISLFFKTDFGLFMRATGNNEIMVSANGVNIDNMKIFGISFANALAALSGGLVAQYQGFADIGMGVGSVVFSLAAVIIGDAIIKSRSIFLKVFSVILGAVIFRLMVALALDVGLNPNDLKIITAIFVLLTLVASKSLTLFSLVSLIKKYRKIAIAGISIALIAPLVYNYFQQTEVIPSVKKIKIGVVLANDSDLLTKTLKGLEAELKRLGYNEQNSEIIIQNANGDIPTTSMIINNFLNSNVDIIVPISTVSTQAAYKLVKDRPVVFATVADPFIIGVGKSDTDHPANITGVYGLAPIKGMLKAAREFFPNNFKLGCLWNPSFPNSVHNVKFLQKILDTIPNTKFVGATFASSADIYQAAQSLTNKKIDAFVLVPDLQVYASFEAVVKAAQAANIPIFTADVERLGDGALMVYGYQYELSGKQAANIIHRIINGESPKNIPYEKYSITTIGLDYDVLNSLKFKAPANIEKIINAKYQNKELIDLGANFTKTAAQKLRVAVFQFADNDLLNTTANGVIDKLMAITQNNKNIEIKIDRLNAQGDFQSAQLHAKGIVSANYDYVVTVSTIAMQAMQKNNTKHIPHIFCAVTDPLKSNGWKSFTEKQNWITGLATPQPVEKTINYIKQIIPTIKKLGIIWNPSESNSEFCTGLARIACQKLGIELIEKTIANVNEIEDAQKSLIKIGIDAFLTSGDATVAQAAPSISKYMLKNKIPYFTNTPGDVKIGALFSTGADYYEVGTKAGAIVETIIGGKNIAMMPIQFFTPDIYNLNLNTAKSLGIKLPENLLTNAKQVIR